MPEYEHVSAPPLNTLQEVTLTLLAFTALTYLLRPLLFRRQVTRLLGFFDAMGELGHSGCAVLMVPMVVPALMSEPSVRLWAAILSLVGGLYFTGEGVAARTGRITKYPQYKSWWSFAHGGMYLGMAQMYWSHDHVIVTPQFTQLLAWATAAFYLWFCGYYLYALVTEVITTRGAAKWGLYLQANFAHLFGIGLPMLVMALWPHVLMPAQSCNVETAESGRGSPAAHPQPGR